MEQLRGIAEKTAITVRQLGPSSGKAGSSAYPSHQAEYYQWADPEQPTEAGRVVQEKALASMTQPSLAVTHLQEAH